MSQTTPSELLSTLGLTPANTPESKTSSAALKRGRAVFLASLVVLGVGSKVIGDYACNYAIDSWVERQRSAITTVDPEIAAIVERLMNDPEVVAEAQEVTATN